MIPGWVDYWNLQTKQGHTYMDEHPLATVLDVLAPKAVLEAGEWAAGNLMDRLPDNVTAHLDRMTQSLNDLGLTKYTREGWLRPINALRQKVQEQYYAMLADSVQTAGAGLTGDFLDPTSEAGQLQELALYNTYKGMNFKTPDDILASSIPDNIKLAYRRYLYEHAAQLELKSKLGVMMQVVRKDTGEARWVSKNSPILKYLRDYDRLSDGITKRSAAFAQATQKLVDAQAAFTTLPSPATATGPLDSLMAAWTKSKTSGSFVDALRQQAIDIDNRASDIFHEKYPTDFNRNLYRGHMTSMTNLSKNLNTLADEFSSDDFKNFANYPEIRKTLRSLNTALSKVRHAADDDAIKSVRATLKDVSDQLAKIKRQYESIVGGGYFSKTVEHDPEALTSIMGKTGLVRTEGAQAILKPEDTPNTYSLHQLANDELQKGTGAGGRLLTQITDAADRQGATITLEATPDSDIFDPVNDPLIKFYKKHGFVADTEQPDPGTVHMTRQPKDQEPIWQQPRGSKMGLKGKLESAKTFQSKWQARPLTKPGLATQWKSLLPGSTSSSAKQWSA